MFGLSRQANAAPIAVLLALLLKIGMPLAAHADACPHGNVLANSRVSGIDLSQEGRALTDGELALAGAPENSREAFALQASTVMTFDLGTEQPVRAMLLQASGGVVYRIEASTDGSSWQPIWLPELTRISGLCAAITEFRRPVTARYLRFSIATGKTGVAVSELAAFCEIPAQWPPGKLTEAFRAPPWWSADGRVRLAKAAVAMAAVCLFAYGVLLQHKGRPRAHQRLRDASLAGLATLSFVLFWNAGQFHYGRFEHLWEFYHHYLGAKYFDELGYTRLYECTAAADVEAGLLQEVETRKIRNLSTNLIEGSARALADPGECTRHFSADRWQAFKTDAAWFRERMGKQSWANAQTDHGYNATPAWSIVGSFLANRTVASDRSIRLLALIDPVLLVIMWAFVWRAFGWRALCVAMIWWGTNHPANFNWNGGAYLRMDWLAFAIISICLARERKMAMAGAALACAAGLRVIPVFMASGLVLKALAHMWRERRLVISRYHLRFALGALVAGSVLLGASSARFGSIDVWQEFAQDSSLHVQTPLTNYVGLPTLLSYEDATNMRRTTAPELGDPYQVWKKARRDTLAERFPLYLAVLATFTGLLIWRVRREEDCVAMVLGIGMIPIATEMTCYYYAILLGFGLLYRQGRNAVAAALCALALFTQIVPLATGYYDEIFSATSVGIVVFVLWVTLVRGEDRRKSASEGE